MLGLSNKKTYEHWTQEFNPTSSYEGSWDKGSKMYFVGLDEQGRRGGMVSCIEENIPSRFVSIKHYGFLKGTEEITSGEAVEQWAGGFENYTFSERDGITTVTVDMDTAEAYKDDFEQKYPAALSKLKALAEQS
jgi:hypothetical protein